MKHLLLVALVWGAAAACRAAPPQEAPAPPTEAVLSPPAPPDRRDLDLGIAQVRSCAWEAGLEQLSDFATRPGTPTDLRVEALSWIGHAHTLLGDPENALVAVQRALELAPDDPWLHYASGTAQLAMGSLEGAIEAYGSALELDRRHIKALQWRGHALAQLGRYEEAEADLAAAVTQLEASSSQGLAAWGGDRRAMLYWTLVMRARVLDALGRNGEADESLEAANRLSP